MVLGGTLRPLPSEPIAGRNPLLQGRESRTPGSGNCAIARAATPVPSRTRRPPLFTMIWVPRRTGGRSRLSTVLAKGLSLPPRPRRHPARPETRFTGAGSCCPIMGRQDPGLSPWPYTMRLRVSPPAGFDSPAGGSLTFLGRLRLYVERGKKASHHLLGMLCSSETEN